ncbi:hypothetical protein ACS0TY_008448 [Phlomoides rotata]
MKGKPKKKHIQLDIERMKAIVFEKRSTIRRLARELNVSKRHIDRWVQEGVIKPYTNQIKPELTFTNKLQRLKFSLNAIVLDRDVNQLKFTTMHNIVHIYEKWFYMKRTCERYYMIPGE